MLKSVGRSSTVKNATTVTSLNKRCIEHSYVCQTCFKCIKVKTRRLEDHICGEKSCPNCKEWVLGEHKCHMLKKPLKPPSEKYIFYDFETTVDNRL